MSFDIRMETKMETKRVVSIPFEQGDVFRQLISLNKPKEATSQSLSSRAMSFDIGTLVRLSTMINVSIPFEQGDVFRLQRYAGGRNHAAFQTHFPIFLEG